MKLVILYKDATFSFDVDSWGSRHTAVENYT